MAADAGERIARAVRSSGLIPPGTSGVALLSGGPDSGCLAAGLASVAGAEHVAALHLNYRLREDSDRDEEACRELCEKLGIELRVERPRLPGGNVQAAAREARYEAAERLRRDTGGEWIAVGHTRSDLAETLLYRLAASPGRRALLGLAPRRGRVVRPLLSLSRAEARELAEAAGLPFRDDPSNVDPRFARVRIRREVLPVLRELNPAAEENIAATWEELAEEGEALEALAAEALDRAGAPDGVLALRAEALEGEHPAVRRLALRKLAERAAGRPVPLGRRRAEELWRLAGRPEGGELDLGEGLTAVCESGFVRVLAREAAAPEAEAGPVELPVPGRAALGRWQLEAELLPGPREPEGPDIATLDAEAVGERLEARTWREGDRMRPLGLAGTKSLQDLFTDRRVPRSLRRSLPVVLARGRIAWVAGVAIGEEFKLRPDSTAVVRLSASLATPS